MTEKNVPGEGNCPCPKKNCPRHGDCAACRSHHAANKWYPPYCDRRKKGKEDRHGSH